LIEKAAWCGADCIKFQVVFADEIIHPLTGKIKLPGGNITLYEKFKQLEKNENFFANLKQEAQKCGLIFLVTPFGIKSAKLLKNIGVSMIKIASPELNHFPLLKEVSSYKLPLILSGGVSKLADIERAVEITGKDITFLHCVTAYPAPEEDYNLALISTLSAIFGFKTGVSDHSKDIFAVPLISAALGASMLEKHFTLDNNAKGLDDLIALNPKDFKTMVTEIRQLTSAADMRNSKKEKQDYALQAVEKRIGKEKTRAIIGNGIKKLAASEKSNYGTTNRSILAIKTIEKGEIIKENDFAILRSEKNILPGIPPEFAPAITGKQAKKRIENGEGITFEHLF
jgi:N-acetylneuraminate synthase